MLPSPDPSPISTPRGSEDAFHSESCSPLADHVASPFVQRHGRRRLRRTVDVMIEEGRIRRLTTPVEPRLRELQPLHLAAQLGDLVDTSRGPMGPMVTSQSQTKHCQGPVNPTTACL